MSQKNPLYKNTFASSANDNVNGSNKPGNGASTPRYASIDDMRAEFGSYRVNAKVENLCDSAEPYPIDPVPFGKMQNQSPFNNQSETPEGY